MLKKWAKAGMQNDTLLIMQINHAGKQSPAVVNKTPLAPSAVPLVGMDGFINLPRELSADEINGLIQQFVQTAKIAEQAGFSGVQIHAAHGYLISQFLSPHHNRRQDQWGGSLENRMRFLLETYTAIRAAVGKDFLVGVKLNSADFQKGGFDKSESVQVVQKLSEMGIDFIEVSGGNYESPQMLAAKDSTRKREAFFIDYAEKARAVSQVPFLVVELNTSSCFLSINFFRPFNGLMCFQTSYRRTPMRCYFGSSMRCCFSSSMRCCFGSSMRCCFDTPTNGFLTQLKTHRNEIVKLERKNKISPS